jgi:flagellar M-ring protein FliF
MDFKTLITQLSNAFLKLNKNHKIIILIIISLIVGFLTFLIVTSMEDESVYGYESLFEKVSYEEAGQIVEELKKDDIPYILERDGDDAIIKVHKDYVDEQRIKIASLGIPQDNKVGFELFNKQDFGSTDFEQKIKYLRAIEGELSRSIEILEPIKSANVHIALPKESLFVEKQVQPTASVVIILKESMILTNKQIKGIKHLVASSIPKLSPENVTLVNAFGESLGDVDELATASEEARLQMTYKHRYEKSYEDKIIEVLAPFIGGKNRVVAKVTIDFDFSKKNSHKEYFDPETVIRSEQVTEENRQGMKPKEVEGVPGAVSNIGPVQGLNDSDTIEKYEKNKATTNYEISKITSEVRGEFSTLKRVTAAVVVDGQYQYKKDENGNETDEYEYVPLDETQLNSIRNLVEQAIGINADRGDEVTVRNFQFQSIKDMMTKKVILKTWQDKIAYYVGPFENVIKYVVAILVLFVFYRKVIVPFSQKMLEETKEDEEFERPIIDMDMEEESDISEKINSMRKKVENELGLDVNVTEEALKYDVLVEKVRGYMEDHTTEVANLLQILIEEESGLGALTNQQSNQ